MGIYIIYNNAGKICGVPLYPALVCVCLPACLESVLNLEFPLNLVTVSIPLNLALITWHYSRDPQTCLTVRSCFPGALRSGNKNWKQNTLSPQKAPKHSCWTRAQVRNAEEWQSGGNSIRPGKGQRGTHWRRGGGAHWSLLRQRWGQAHQSRLVS